MKTLLGILWALPLTLLALPVLPFFRFFKRDGAALCFVIRERFEKRLFFDGQVCGTVILYRFEKHSPQLHRHEMEHVRQCMRLGVCQPALYALCSLAIWAGTDLRPYEDNPLERAARKKEQG
jgi:hypothetical protein